MKTLNTVLSLAVVVAATVATASEYVYTYSDTYKTECSLAYAHAQYCNTYVVLTAVDVTVAPAFVYGFALVEVTDSSLAYAHGQYSNTYVAVADKSNSVAHSSLEYRFGSFTHIVGK
jgi:hypothetical protein